MLTLTFADVPDVKEAQRRFNSFATGELRKRYPSFITVVERGAKSGRVHFHLLVAVAQDIKAGVDFDAFEQGDYRSAGAYLRAEWRWLRGVAPRYRFGRTELLPIYSNAKAVGRYVGKYIGKHLAKRIDADKGVRLVRYSRMVGKASCRFSWATPGGREWRRKLAKMARACGIDSIGEFSDRFGRRWAFVLRHSIGKVDVIQQSYRYQKGPVAVGRPRSIKGTWTRLRAEAMRAVLAT
jgi:plasmid replication initiation protein